MPQTLQKNIRVTSEQWDRIVNAATQRQVSPNQLVVDLVMDALDRNEWPSTEAEIRVARASLFAAQAIARDLLAAGRENEVEEIREFISTIVPDPDAEPPTAVRNQANDLANVDASTHKSGKHPRDPAP